MSTAREIPPERHCYVFSSNLTGEHRRGTAKTALVTHGAVMGISAGPTGQSYAIPVYRRDDFELLSLAEIHVHVAAFVLYAVQHPETRFLVTPIALGNGRYAAHQIAPMFLYAPGNCLFDARMHAALTAQRALFG